MFDLIHDPTAAPVYLPSIYASLETMTSMRPGAPISNSISAIQTTLRNINPSYEWSPPTADVQSADPNGVASSRSQPSGYLASSNGTPLESDSLAVLPLPTSPWDVPHLEMLDFDQRVGSEELLDFMQSDVGCDFDISTMDFEAFLSVNRSPDNLPASVK